MMEILTLPVPAAPASTPPVTPEGGEGAAASVDFSVLLGTAQMTPPALATDSAVTPVADSVAALVSTAGAVPMLPPVEVIVPAAPAAIMLPAAVSAGVPTTDTPVEPEASADPAQAAVVAGVNLPTLPKDFVAQKTPRTAKPAGDDDSDSDAPEGDPDAHQPQAACAAAIIAAPVETAPASQAAPEVPVGMPQPIAPRLPDAAAAAPGSAQSDAALLAVAPETPQGELPSTMAEQSSRAPRADTAAAPESAASPVVTDMVAAALPKLHNDRSARTTLADDKAVAGAERAAASATATSMDTAAAPAIPQQQPATVNQPAAVTAQPTIVLDDLFVAGAGDSAWMDRLADDITTLASGEAREARMKLNPRILGDMAVRLEMDGRHTRVHFTVETQQAQQMIADGAQRLTSLVEANGLKLDGATVDLDQRRSGGEPDRRAQAAEQFETQRGTRGGRDSGIALAVARTRLATATERFA